MPIQTPLVQATIAPALVAWYDNQGRILPWRLLWASERNPYHVWLSEIMLQQTVIKAVLPAYPAFLQRFPDIQTLAAADGEAVRLASRGLGYYRRFDLMHKAARALVAKGGSWPTSYEGWRELPGVGEYTAGAISSIVLGEAQPAVDGNVERVFCRLLDIREPPNQLRLKAQFRVLARELIDVQRPGDFNQALMQLGQTVCRKAAPLCTECPIASSCLAAARGSQALAPQAKAKKTAPIPTLFKVAVPLLGAERMVGLVRRSAGARFLQNTWGFPFSYSQSGNEPTMNDGEFWPVPDVAPVGQFRHNITHHRIDAGVFPVLTTDTQYRWLSWQEAENHLVSSLDLKAWRLALKSQMSAESSRKERH